MTILTPKRAREIWESKGPFGEWPKGSYTPEEDAAIRAFWETMPGHASWASALMAIMNDALKVGDFVSIVAAASFGRIAVAFPYGDRQLYAVRYYADGLPFVCPDARCPNSAGKPGATDWRSDARTCPICTRNAGPKSLTRIPDDQLALLRAEGLIKE